MVVVQTKLQTPSIPGPCIQPGLRKVGEQLYQATSLGPLSTRKPSYGMSKGTGGHSGAETPSSQGSQWGTRILEGLINKPGEVWAGVREMRGGRGLRSGGMDQSPKKGEKIYPNSPGSIQKVLLGVFACTVTLMSQRVDFSPWVLPFLLSQFRPLHLFIRLSLHSHKCVVQCPTGHYIHCLASRLILVIETSLIVYTRLGKHENPWPDSSVIPPKPHGLSDNQWWPCFLNVVVFSVNVIS